MIYSQQQARLNVISAVSLIQGGFKVRDPREPGKDRKEAFEARLFRVVRAHFNRQKRGVREILTQWYPNRKEIEVPPIIWDDIYKDDKFERDVLMTMTGASQDGVTLASELIPLGIDYTAVNTVAMNWAATYSGQLIKGLEKTTLKAIKAAIAAFIRTPGMTIGDVMSLLPFGESRALRIAVTEITRAYGQAEELVGIQLEKEFPDVEVVKTWYTNNDDLVCNICAPLDGMTVLRQEGFTTEKDKSLGIPSPPAHVNCRCWMSTTTRIT